MNDIERKLWNSSGRYSDVKEIGRGGQGEVYRAYDNETHRLVAIKTIRLDRESETTSARFHQEILALSRLSHPNVVSLLEDGSSSGQNFYVMDFVEGYSLLDYLEQEKPTQEEIVELFITLCKALTAMHEADVLHRDLKPDNIRVTTEGKPMIIDFGLVLLTEQEVERMTQTGHFVGTLNYMAPEVLINAEYDTTSDVYQLGALLYKSLSGKLPLSPVKIMELARGDKVRPTPIQKYLPDLDNHLAKIVDKAVAFQANERFQRPKELATALSSCLGKTSALSGLTSVSLGTERKPRRSFLPPLLILALSLFLLHALIAPTEPLSICGMRLKSLVELTLLFKGRPSGTCTISLKRVGQEPRTKTLSLSGLQPLPGKTWALSVPLQEPIAEKTEVFFKGAGIVQRRVINPNPIINELFSPLEEIEGQKYKDFLSWCRGARQRLYQSRHEAGYRKTKERLKLELTRRLDRLGLDKEKCRQISLLVPQLKKLGISENYYRKLLPLRFVESALCSQASIAPPWQSVTRALGYDFEKADVPLERAQWEVVDRVKLTQVVDGKTSWLWLTDNEALRSKRNSGFDDLMISMAMKKIITNRSVHLPASERYPTLDTIKNKEQTQLHIGKLHLRNFPPQRAFLAIDLRLLHPTTSLVLRLNDSVPVYVTLPGSGALPPTDYVQRRVRVVVPINVKSLKLGDNKLSMQTKTMPGQIPHWLIAVREVALLFSRQN